MKENMTMAVSRTLVAIQSDVTTYLEMSTPLVAQKLNKLFSKLIKNNDYNTVLNALIDELKACTDTNSLTLFSDYIYPRQESTREEMNRYTNQLKYINAINDTILRIGESATTLDRKSLKILDQAKERMSLFDNANKAYRSYWQQDSDKGIYGALGNMVGLVKYCFIDKKFTTRAHEAENLVGEIKKLCVVAQRQFDELSSIKSPVSAEGKTSFQVHTMWNRAQFNAEEKEVAPVIDKKLHI